MLSLHPIPPSSLLKEYDANFDVVIPFEDLRLPKNPKVRIHLYTLPKKDFGLALIPIAFHIQISEAIRKFYFGDLPIDENTLVNFYEYLSDLNFIIDTDHSVKQHVAHSKSKTYYAWYVSFIA